MAAGRAGREAAMQVLYQLEDVHGRLPSDASLGLQQYFQNFQHDENARAEATALVEGVCNRRDEIDDMIEKRSHRWKLARMAKVDRNVLRLAAWELLARPDVPTRVVLNEAIELGKRFGTEQSHAFINGILDPVAKEVRHG
jgi:N utilization substance protein B